MKALSIDRLTAMRVITGEQPTVTMRRSVPREMIGRKCVLHAKAFKTGSFKTGIPSAGVGYVTFGEARPLLNGDCEWPVTAIEPWAKHIRAPARTGFWVWSYDHG